MFGGILRASRNRATGFDGPFLGHRRPRLRLLVQVARTNHHARRWGRSKTQRIGGRHRIGIDGHLCNAGDRHEHGARVGDGMAQREFGLAPITGEDIGRDDRVGGHHGRGVGRLKCPVFGGVSRSFDWSGCFLGPIGCKLCLTLGRCKRAMGFCGLGGGAGCRGGRGRSALSRLAGLLRGRGRESFRCRRRARCMGGAGRSARL